MKEHDFDDEEDADQTRDEFLNQIDRNRVTVGLFRCFPIYLFIWPYGLRRKKITILYLVLLYLMMLLVLILANIYVLYRILPSLIENSIFRIPNDNLSKFVDRASVLKKYDMQILINDILIFDQILGYVSANPSTQSTYDPETTSPQLLTKAYQIPQSGPTQNDTMYYIRPKSTLSASGETVYYQFSKDFHY